MKALASLLFLAFSAAHAADDGAVGRYFDTLDLNGDGYVSLSEAAGQEVVIKRFDRGDRNKDGKLSRKEFANLSKVKVRVAKKKGEEPSAALGASAPKKKEKNAAGG
ncbi:MAG: hypothetical protein ABR570_01070 [Burkholderiales bacterium]